MRFVIEETVTYEIDATDADEALAIWLDKGEEAAGFTGVRERDIYPKKEALGL